MSPNYAHIPGVFKLHLPPIKVNARTRLSRDFTKKKREKTDAIKSRDK